MVTGWTATVVTVAGVAVSVGVDGSLVVDGSVTDVAGLTVVMGSVVVSGPVPPVSVTGVEDVVDVVDVVVSESVATRPRSTWPRSDWTSRATSTVRSWSIVETSTAASESTVSSEPTSAYVGPEPSGSANSIATLSATRRQLVFAAREPSEACWRFSILQTLDDYTSAVRRGGIALAAQVVADEPVRTGAVEDNAAFVALVDHLAERDGWTAQRAPTIRPAARPGWYPAVPAIFRAEADRESPTGYGPMLDGAAVRGLLQEMSDHLHARGERAQLFVVGGAAMALGHDHVRLTRDVDALFVPAPVVRQTTVVERAEALRSGRNPPPPDVTPA